MMGNFEPSVNSHLSLLSGDLGINGAAVRKSGKCILFLLMVLGSGDQYLLESECAFIDQLITAINSIVKGLSCE